ncbi:MAG: DUF1883 domain-containing protein [Firmicutes bacterium]|nr:DUF1883 domain-containing protein [Bacillota bacterium]
MDFIHAREYLSKGDIVVVNCSHQSNVLLTDDVNFEHYRNEEAFTYYGGHRKRFPTRIVVPFTGYWNVTIDLAGGEATIRHNISFIKRS